MTFSADQQLALKAALAAARLLEQAWREERALEVKDKGLHDYVTQLDRESEELIRSILLAGPSGHGFLAEEGGGDVGDAASFWVVDPLDGTSNFVHRYPAFAVSVGLLERGGTASEPLPTASASRRFPQLEGCRSRLGVIVDVCHRQVYFAESGAGAWRSAWDDQGLRGDPARLACGRAERLEDAFLATGFPIRYRDLAHLYLHHFERIMPRSAGLRRGGSAALDLAYTAAGVFDGFFELYLSPWDLAAGVCLVEEAGGAVRGIEGDPIADGHLAAAIRGW